MKKISLLFLLALAAACSSKPAPKDVVFDFIDAVRSADSSRVTHLLDIDAYLKMNMPEMSPEDSATVFREQRNLPLERLFGPGDVRERWANWQIVVNKEIKRDGEAMVEVSFVNKMVGYQLYTTMQLQRQPDGAWKITYFE